MNEASATNPVSALGSGKGHKDENFPVASFMLKREHRAPVMAFYKFARAADDVADNPVAGPQQRLALLNEMRATLAGTSDTDVHSLALRQTLAERGLSPVHGLDLLTAFERDCTVNRYESWESLMDYCAFSAMPVGRYVLDVHGESSNIWPASDALCAALQVINHVQDCGKDYRGIDRVYLPLDMLGPAGALVSDLARSESTPALRSVIAAMAHRTDALLLASKGFAAQIRDRRLRMEVAVIHRLAVSLNERLKRRDPLSQRVHHRPWEAFGLAASAAIGGWAR